MSSNDTMVSDGARPYLFLEPSFGNPAAELRATFDRKRQMHEGLGEVVAALDLERAYHVARRALEAALASPACTLRAPRCSHSGAVAEVETAQDTAPEPSRGEPTSSPADTEATGEPARA